MLGAIFFSVMMLIYSFISGESVGSPMGYEFPLWIERFVMFFIICTSVAGLWYQRRSQ